MAKKQTDSVYRVVDVVGVSDKSWEDAGRRAVETAAGSLRDLRVAEVTKMDMRVENGKVLAFRTRVALSFKYRVLTQLTAAFAIGRAGAARRTAYCFPAAFLAASLRKYPHGDDKEDGGEEDKAVKVRLDRRAAPQHKPERHRDDATAETAAFTSFGMARPRAASIGADRRCRGLFRPRRLAAQIAS